MAGAGLILLLIGLVLLMPRGSAPGSIAARNVPIYGSHIDRTPGYQAAPEGRSRMVRIGTGLALVALGVVLLVIGL